MPNAAKSSPGRSDAQHNHRKLTLWILIRLLEGALLLLIVSFIIFAATQALPGDVARLILGKDATGSFGPP